MDLFAALKEKGLEAIIQKSAPQLLELMAHIHADQTSIALSLMNIADRLASIDQRLDTHGRALAQIMARLPPPQDTINRMAVLGERLATSGQPYVDYAAPFETRKALHDGKEP
jgi:hypothetical protein